MAESDDAHVFRHGSASAPADIRDIRPSLFSCLLPLVYVCHLGTASLLILIGGEPTTGDQLVHDERPQCGLVVQV